VTLAPVALELALSRMPIPHVPRVRLAVWRSLAAGTGFGAAHFLHFMEVCAYLGSCQAAVHDMTAAASYRFGTDLHGGLYTHLFWMDSIVKHYYFGEYPVSTFFWDPGAHIEGSWQAFRFLGFSLGLWWLALYFVFGFVHFRVPRAERDGSSLTRDFLLVSVYGFVPSMAWMLVMTNHAMNHVIFRYRHLFFCFFVWLLFGVTCCARAYAVSMTSQRPTTSRGTGFAETIIPASSPQPSRCTWPPATANHAVAQGCSEPDWSSSDHGRETDR
jgi:hypothetical protein